MIGVLTEDQTKIARSLWSEGATLSEIGRQLGRSKGSVSNFIWKRPGMFPPRRPRATVATRKDAPISIPRRIIMVPRSNTQSTIGNASFVAVSVAAMSWDDVA